MGKKILYFSLAIILFWGTNINAQHSQEGNKEMSKIGILSGTVNDTEGHAVEYATVSLFNMRNNSLVTGGVTNPKGYFNLKELPLGVYIVKVKFIGFETTVIKPIYLFSKGRGKGQGTEQNLGTIKLATSDVFIEGVNVVADKSHVEYKIDKKIVNVSQDINSAGGTAVDVLENTPSVQVDIDGNVSLRGSSNFTVLIDGKPTVLESSDVLQQIPANAIQDIEIITNPSAKYDPDGAAGIINVVMKKKKSRGFNGLINVSAGTRDKYKGNVLLNYKTGKLNFMTGVDYRNETRFGSGLQNRTTYYPDTTYYLNYSGARNMNIYGLGFKAGVDYYINDNNSLSLSGRFGNRKFERGAKSYYHEYTEPFSLDDYYLRDNSLGYTGKTYSANLTYDLKFKKPNTKLEVLLFYSNWDGKRIDDQNKYLTDQKNIIIDNNPERSKADQINPRDEYRYQLDFNSTIGKGAFEAGYQGRINISTGDYKYSNYDLANDIWIPDLEKSNKAEFFRNIQAVYSTYASKIIGLDYKMGLRAEYTNRLIDQITTNEQFIINRIDFFPSAYVTKQINKKYQAQISYSRRMNRPRNRNLNPFPNYGDPLNIRVGNPDLQPEYVDSYELNFQSQFNKSFIALETFYRRTNNLISRVNILGDNNIITRTYGNLNHDNSVGAELSANLKLTKWWRLNGSSSVYYYSILGEIDSEYVSSESVNWNLRLNNTFSFKKNTRIQLTGYYRGPSVTAQGTTEAFFFTSLAVRQDFLKKNFTATLQVRDLFNSMKHEFVSQSSEFYTYTNFHREGQVFTLSLTYRINNYKEKRVKSKESDNMGIDMEQ